MKSFKTIIGLSVLLFFTQEGSVAQDYWVQLDSIKGAPRSVASAFTLAGEGYTVGGIDGGGFRRKMYSFDQFQNDWDEESPIGGENGSGLNRGSASAFSIGSKGYVCLGQNDSAPFLNDLWEYDPYSETWSQKADFIGTARRQAANFVLDGIAYIIGGSTLGGLSNQVFAYDPVANSWTQKGNFAGTGRKEAVGFAMGAEGYVGTGDDGVMRKDFWQYLPTTDTWVQLPDFPGTPRKGAVGWGLFPNAYIALGEDNTFAYKNDLWEYNKFTSTWIQRADLPGPGRSNAFVFVLDNVPYLGSGYNGDFLDDFYGYVAILGLNDISIELSLGPNPATDFVTGNVAGSIASIEVVDYLGKNCSNHFDIQLGTNGNFKLINKRRLQGRYIIRISDPLQRVVSAPVLFQ